MKVRELRRALERIPDDVNVILANDRYWGYVYEANNGAEAELTSGEQLSLAEPRRVGLTGAFLFSNSLPRYPHSSFQWSAALRCEQPARSADLARAR
jgi:hypothetical protein